MRFLFKTDYEDDIRLFPHSGYVASYGCLLLLLILAPFVLGSYLISGSSQRTRSGRSWTPARLPRRTPMA